MSQLTYQEQKNLLLLARKVIEEKLFGKSELNPQVDTPIFQTKKGAFVTLHKSKKLRGCIGLVEVNEPLKEVIIKMAYSSAFHDPRFTPLSRDEYPQIDIEISVLSEPKRAQSPDELKVGLHGIIISHGSHKGLLLPQVAVENHWNRETFLRHGCLKASLPQDMWQRGAQIDLFEAEVFGEEAQ